MMIEMRTNPVDIARNLFAPSLDGGEHPQHQQRLALVATLLESGTYDDLSAHQAIFDLDVDLGPRPQGRLGRIVRGFTECVFPDSISIVKLPELGVEKSRTDEQLDIDISVMTAEAQMMGASNHQLSEAIHTLREQRLAEQVLSGQAQNRILV